VAATALRLTFAIADYSHTAALKSGAVRFEGIAPQFADVKPQVAAYRRIVRQVEFLMALRPTFPPSARSRPPPTSRS
jgi:4,5-dihydroxyphthalate decarboxylase